MNGNGRMAGGLLIGMVLGIVAGALIWPRSGRENRAMLQEKIGELGDMMKRGRSRLQSEVERAMPSRESDYLP
jgi:gas vesicle protein